MYCPVCGDEYRDGFTHCKDCDADLVPERPQAPEPPKTTPAVTPKGAAPSNRHSRFTPRLLFGVGGALLGIVVTLAFQQGIRYWRYHRYRTSTIIMSWAYHHVPQVIGYPSPYSARALDVEWQSTGDERVGELRLVYENDGTIRVLKTKYRVQNGQVVVPTDQQLRQLNAAAPGVATDAGRD